MINHSVNQQIELRLWMKVEKILRCTPTARLFGNQGIEPTRLWVGAEVSADAYWREAEDRRHLRHVNANPHYDDALLILRPNPAAV